MKFLVRNIPRQTLIRFSYSFSWLISIFYSGKKVYCPVCNSHFRKLLPYGNKGGDNRLCPRCLSLERHRLLWLYLKNKTTFFSDQYKVLHVAPEQAFRKRFKKLENLDYTTGDLVSPIADVKMDILDIPFEENTFDWVICNHVLEHVDSDINAMKEVLRVLKPGGRAILQVPIDYKREKTYEDPSITDPKEREKHFGQYDHVRFHGLDYAERLRSAGFKVDEVEYIKEFSDEEVQKMRLPSKEVIFLNKKEA